MFCLRLTPQPACIINLTSHQKAIASKALWLLLKKEGSTSTTNKEKQATAQNFTLNGMPKPLQKNPTETGSIHGQTPPNPHGYSKSPTSAYLHLKTAWLLCRQRLCRRQTCGHESRISPKPRTFSRTAQSSFLPAAINLTLTFFLSRILQQRFSQSNDRLRKLGCSHHNFNRCLLENILHLGQHCLLPTQNQHVGAFDDFPFLIERLKRFSNCVLPAGIFIFKP